MSDTHTQLNPEHVHRRDPHRARRAQAARRAPRARPRARVRRRRAGETLRRHRTRCEVRARPIRLSDTRTRPRRTRRARPPPPGRANRITPDRRRRPRRDRRSCDAARRRFRRARPPTVRVFPLRATTDRDRDARRKRRARGPSPPRALRAVDFDTRTSAEMRRGRGGALAFARPLPSDTTHAHNTTRHVSERVSDTPVPFFHRACTKPLINTLKKTSDAPPTRFWRARVSRPRARASAAAARCRFSVTPPAFA